MFNRAIQVKMVKTDKKAAPAVAKSDQDFEQKAVIATALAERVVKKAALGVAGYVVLDTFRRVLVTLAEKS